MSQLRFAKHTDPLPPAIWVPSSSLRVYRGTPVDIIREMTVELGDKPMREKLRALVEELAKARKIMVQLPWNQSDEVVSSLFIHALMALKIGRPVPQA